MSFVRSGPRTDAQRVVLTGAASRVERWSVASGERVGLATLPMLVCGTEQLSPDGGVFVCLDLTGNLFIVDVASGQAVFEEKHFASLFQIYTPRSGVAVGHTGDPGSARIDFSPDGRFVSVKPENAEGSVLLWNVIERKKVRLKGRLRKLQSASFTFLAPHRVFSKPKIPLGLFARTTGPGFVIIRPFGRYFHGHSDSKRAAAVELETDRVIVRQYPLLDVFGPSYISEHEPGVVGLYEIGKGLKAPAIVYLK